jgi:hypothetical protein
MKSIDPRGISTGHNPNGAPYVEKRASLPPSQTSPDKGAAQGGLKKGPAARPDKGIESRSMSVKQKASSTALNAARPGGLKKR